MSTRIAILEKEARDSLVLNEASGRLVPTCTAAYKHGSTVVFSLYSEFFKIFALLRNNKALVIGEGKYLEKTKIGFKFFGLLFIGRPTYRFCQL